jgi:ADP-ribose pyrophosphatase
MKPDEPKLISHEFFHRGRVFDASHDIVELPSGVRLELDVIHHNGGAAVLPLFENGDVLLVEQYRHPAREVLLEIPAGHLEAGEDPLAAAARELEEETGWRAAHIDFVTRFYALPGYSNEILHCFVATGLTPGERRLDDDEDIHTLRIPFADALARIENGQIKDAKSMMTLLLMARRFPHLTGA